MGNLTFYNVTWLQDKIRVAQLHSQFGSKEWYVNQYVIFSVGMQQFISTIHIPAGILMWQYLIRFL